MDRGRVTLPIEVGMDDEVRSLVERLGADAVRNSDGTELPDWVDRGFAKVLATYFPARGDEEWADRSTGERIHQYLLSRRHLATDSTPLEIDVMEGWFQAQFRPDTDCDTARWWQVVDRTSGRALDPSEWTVRATPPRPLGETVLPVGDLPREAGSAVVTVAAPEEWHTYTVSFLAVQVWDSTQMYNYLTNGWATDPTRAKERPFDVVHPRTWDHVRHALATWLDAHPEVDVVRFTTFFYHFTLAFDEHAREGYVDWFGYSASVSVQAMEEFERRTGERLTAEDFVDAGWYNSPFRPPTRRFRQWIDFTAERVAERARALVDQVHAAGREAMMFLGDNWIGTEPYGPRFPSIGLDAVVGSVGSAATCRMISDIPGVTYTEGRFLPYFFPDVFNPQGDPIGEARECWRTARRAIVRSPLDRMGYGGYLSLAAGTPGFIDCVEDIVSEFRAIHDRSGGRRPETEKVVVGVLNAWGPLRSWQTHMVAHALPYRETRNYAGVLEALAGLPFEVRFLSFEEVADPEGSALEGVDVLVNAGAAGTSFSGGPAWRDVRLQERVRSFVGHGGGLVGVGEPTAWVGPESLPPAHEGGRASVPAHGGGRSQLSPGTVFALADVLGVDREVGWSLSTDRHPTTVGSHFLSADLHGSFDHGEEPGAVVATDPTTQVVVEEGGRVRLSTHDFGNGRGVYLAGLPWSPQNSRLLHRTLMWAAHREGEWGVLPVSSDPAVEVAWYPGVSRALAYNSSDRTVETRLSGLGADRSVHLGPGASRWLDEDGPGGDAAQE